MSKSNDPQHASTDGAEPAFARGLAIVREVVIAALGVGIVATTLTMVLLAWTAGNVSPAEWDRKQVLLTYINGLTGVVLGYYFGRAPTEARAQAAENEARRATREEIVAREDRERMVGEVTVIANSLGAAPRTEANGVLLSTAHVESLRTLARRRTPE